MNDVENELKKMSRTAASRDLDARVQATLNSPPSPLARPVPLWACAAACLACLAAGWLLRTAPSPAATPHLSSPAPVATARLVCSVDTTIHLPASPFIGRRFAD